MEENKLSKSSISKIKNIKYSNEQNDILNKIYNIIGLDENKRSFYTHEFDYDEDKRKLVEDLSEDIKKYFSASLWSCFNKKKKLDKQYISLIKNIFKDLKIQYNSQSCKIKKDNKYINSTQYILL